MRKLSRLTGSPQTELIESIVGSYQRVRYIHQDNAGGLAGVVPFLLTRQNEPGAKPAGGIVPFLYIPDKTSCARGAVRLTLTLEPPFEVAIFHGQAESS